jgi:hypothetical protein
MSQKIKAGDFVQARFFLSESRTKCDDFFEMEEYIKEDFSREIFLVVSVETELKVRDENRLEGYRFVKMPAHEPSIEVGKWSIENAVWQKWKVPACMVKKVELP